jgi:DNA-binding transcriptional LysR family regulator
MFDPALLTTFVTVAKAASFSEAGRRLGLRQSTVSQHIRRLFVRDTHSVTLTADGEAMLALAHGILEANERARQYFAVSELRGRVRFGAAEDFVQSKCDSFMPAGLAELPRSAALPELGSIEFVVAGGERALRGPANALASAILDRADRL